jgi:hypothetical protein
MKITILVTDSKIFWTSNGEKWYCISERSIPANAESYKVSNKGNVTKYDHLKDAFRKARNMVLLNKIDRILEEV